MQAFFFHRPYWQMVPVAFPALLNFLAFLTPIPDTSLPKSVQICMQSEW